jgi:uncharacterized protein (TIGR03790 family)
MRTLTLFAFIIVLMGGNSGLKAQSYNDVLVIVNSNSTMSQDVAAYFKTQRSIPNVNICSVAMPTTDEIDSASYVTIVNSIKNYISSNGLSNSINYIVTTQGVPLKVRRSSSVFSTMSNASSFDSDLCLMNSSLEAQMGKAGYATNPYAYSTARFSRSSTFSNIYLVTRLAGYTYSDIVGLIDRARQPYMSAGQFVFDVDVVKGANALNIRMNTAKNTLRGRGFNVMFDSSAAYVVNQDRVLGYTSWGSNDANWSSYTQKAQPHFNWSAKALAEWYVSSSGRSFSDSNFVEPTIGWQAMSGDLVHEGVTGVKGYVWEPYSTAMARVDYLFERWTNATGYTLAESYYIASACIGWMDVVIGDPKATFAGQGHLPVELVAFGGTMRNTEIHLHWKTATEVNNYGFEVQKQVAGEWNTLGFVAGNGTSNAANNYSFIDNSVRDENMYRLRQIDRDGTTSYSNIIRVSGFDPQGFQLAQNYPNPFSGTTSVAFTIPVEANVSVRIFTVTGEELTSLLTGETLTAGTHTIPWTGTDAIGNTLPAGMYLCRMTASQGQGPAFTDTKLMSLVR